MRSFVVVLIVLVSFLNVNAAAPVFNEKTSFIVWKGYGFYGNSFMVGKIVDVKEVEGELYLLDEFENILVIKKLPSKYKLFGMNDAKESVINLENGPGIKWD